MNPQFKVNEPREELFVVGGAPETSAGQPVQSPSDALHRLRTLAEMQRRIAIAPLDLESAVSLVIQRTREFTSAASVVVGLIEEDNLVYRYATWSQNGNSPLQVRTDSSLSAECLRAGETVWYDDAQSCFVTTSASGEATLTASCIVAPLRNQGKIIGTIEVLAEDAHLFNLADVYTVELTSGLLSTALMSAAGIESEEAIAAERTTMLQAIEKISTCLRPLVGEQQDTTSAEQLPARSQRDTVENLDSLLDEIQPLLQPSPSGQLQNSPVEAEVHTRECNVSALEEGPAANRVPAGQNVGDASVTQAPPQFQQGSLQAPKTPLADASMSAGDELQRDQSDHLVETIAPPRPQDMGGEAGPSFVRETGTKARRRRRYRSKLLAGAGIAVLLVGAISWRESDLKRHASTQRIVASTGSPSVPKNATNRNSQAAGELGTQIPSNAQGWSGPVDSGISAQGQDKSPQVELTGLRYWPLSNDVMVAIEFNHQVTFDEAQLANPDRIFFDFHNCRANMRLEGRGFDSNDPLLQRIRLATHGTDTRVTMQFNLRAEYTLTASPNPRVLLIRFHSTR